MNIAHFSTLLHGIGTLQFIDLKTKNCWTAAWQHLSSENENEDFGPLMHDVRVASYKTEWLIVSVQKFGPSPQYLQYLLSVLRIRLRHYQHINQVTRHHQSHTPQIMGNLVKCGSGGRNKLNSKLTAKSKEICQH